jgi:hypothetical protein
MLLDCAVEVIKCGADTTPCGGEDGTVGACSPGGLAGRISPRREAQIAGRVTLHKRWKLSGSMVTKIGTRFVTGSGRCGAQMWAPEPSRRFEADVDRASLESAMDASGWQVSHYEVLPDRVLVYLWPRTGAITLRFCFGFGTASTR